MEIHMKNSDNPKRIDPAITSILYDARKWMKTSGIVLISISMIPSLIAITARFLDLFKKGFILSIIASLLFAVPLIILGIMLLQTVAIITRAHNEEKSPAHISAMEKLKTCLIFQGIFAIPGTMLLLISFGLLVMALFHIRF